MLPFLKPKPQTGVIFKTRPADEKEEQEEINENEGLEACAQDLINAVHAHDVKAVAEALHAAFEIAESMPHYEGEHIDEEPHSYEDQEED